MRPYQIPNDVVYCANYIIRDNNNIIKESYSIGKRKVGGGIAYTGTGNVDFIREKGETNPIVCILFRSKKYAH